MMLRRSHVLAVCAAASLLCASASAQAINLDIGRLNGAPSASYGAAAGQAGFGNRMYLTGGGPLQDLSGAATNVSVSASNVHTFAFGFDNPNTSGDDELLLDAGHDGELTLEFVGLQDTDYFVYTYAFAADNRTNYITNVAVTGSPDPMQAAGGTRRGGTHVQQQTYAKHRVSGSGGTRQIVCTVGKPYAALNGVQLEPTLPLPVVYCTPK